MEADLRILEKQEQLLRFEQFSHEEAFKLGCFMAERAKQNQTTIAVSIRLNNGCTVFQYCPEGTNALNQKWMERKFNTVKLMERSSLLSALSWEKEESNVAIHGLKSEEYALCGGGFPIRVKGTNCVIGAVIASNLYHIADHEFVVDSLKEYLNLPETPSFPYEIP